ncbi:MAG: hypothetical protein LBJ10_09485 [Clostridiales bacterium]|jgi:hypothetical protein|nr:hypothetical protein [Clostridiales bacterium]
MRCRYCFYADAMENRKAQNYGMMSYAMLEAIVRRTVARARGGRRREREAAGGWLGANFTARHTANFSAMRMPGLRKLRRARSRAFAFPA